MTPFVEAGLAIQIHMIAATAALVLGAIVLWRRKGGALHRISGRIWLALMMVTAFSGFFIHEIRMWGVFSPIHFFSVLVPVSLVWAIHSVRRGKVREHLLIMRSTYLGLVAAGAFTLLPTRIPFEMLFGRGWVEYDPPFAWMVPLAVAAAIALLISRRPQAR